MNGVFVLPLHRHESNFLMHLYGIPLTARNSGCLKCYVVNQVRILDSVQELFCFFPSHVYDTCKVKTKVQTLYNTRRAKIAYITILINNIKTVQKLKKVAIFNVSRGTVYLYHSRFHHQIHQQV